MYTNDSDTNAQRHRGSFADGQASVEPHPSERHIGTFSEGETTHAAYPGQDHAGTFAEGQAHPDQYAGEDSEGTFSEGLETSMSARPSIDLHCTRCGARHIYQLVPLEERPREDEVRPTPREIASIDFRCSRCSASQTYKLVPDTVPASQGQHQNGNRQAGTVAALDDLTLGREVGAAPYEDPTQGREIGHRPYEDPTRTR